MFSLRSRVTGGTDSRWKGERSRSQSSIKAMLCRDFLAYKLQSDMFFHRIKIGGEASQGGLMPAVHSLCSTCSRCSAIAKSELHRNSGWIARQMSTWICRNVVMSSADWHTTLRGGDAADNTAADDDAACALRCKMACHNLLLMWLSTPYSGCSLSSRCKVEHAAPPRTNSTLDLCMQARRP